MTYSSGQIRIELLARSGIGRRAWPRTVRRVFEGQSGGARDTNSVGSASADTVLPQIMLHSDQAYIDRPSGTADPVMCPLSLST
jgi:hypothetical protein